jgi:hypothetical protein
LWNELTDYIENLESPVSWEEALVAIGFSFIASVLIYLMYQIFYGSRQIGAGVHRTFLLGGISITALFLAIQTSIPLSLGLLGALSFVRFRTPVKDPEEIGFLLLLIATSIMAATENFMLAIMLVVAVLVTLSFKWFNRNRFAFFGRGNLMISIDRPSFDSMEPRLTGFLNERLRGLRLQTMSVLDDRVSLHYQYRQKKVVDWAAFTSEINHLDPQAKIEVFIG